MSQETLLEIAVDCPLSGTFTYKSMEPLSPGCQVMVPFGNKNRKVSGIVVGESKAVKGLRLKRVAAVLGTDPVLSPAMLRLGRWLSEYYLHPIGEVFRTMLPASEKVKTNKYWSLTELGLEVWGQKDAGDHTLVRSLFKRRSPLLDASFQKNLLRLAEEQGRRSTEIEKEVSQKGLIESELSSGFTEKKLRVNESSEAGQASEPKTLTEKQNEVFEAICEGVDSDDAQVPPYLLWGVTGAGKTEIYLQTISHMLSRHPNGQALVMVPEISLTPQMTMVFEQRFPSDVAVVHSAMTMEERRSRLDRIASRDARILVGPRSAVFAPFKELRLIFVDEEHDSSYKQTTGLSYNGRDVAILRGRLESAIVILGSATPSIESFQNARTNKYRLLELLERVQSRPLPTVELVEQVPNRGRGQTIKGGMESCEIPVSQRILDELRQNCEQRQQSIVIVNRRGFAYFLFSVQKREAVSCPQCSVSLTVHKSSETLKCHYCEYGQKLSDFMNSDEQYLIVGYGSEQAETYLQRQLPDANVVRVDSDTVAKKGALESVLDDFRSGKIDVLVGTQILAKGHDFPNVTLMCLLEVDQMLNLPDFRAGERTFQLMVQASGRAGRAELEGRVMVQSQKPEDVLIQSALAQDYKGFAERELEFREVHSFPPFSKMVHFEFSSLNGDKLEAYMASVDKAIENLMEKKPEYRETLSVLGPTVPPIEMIRRRFRRSLVLSSPNQVDLWNAAKYLKLALAKFPADLRIKVDVDPQSIL